MNIPFIANHDTDRAAGYLTVASGRMQMAANLYILSPGSPFIYYGEEIGLRGSRGGANRRLAMLWGDGDTVRDPEGSTYDKQTPYSVKDLEGMSGSILQHYRKLMAIRRANPEIARGVLTALSFPDSKLGGFLCAWNGSTAGVFHNTTDRLLSVDLSAVSDHTFTQVCGSHGMRRGAGRDGPDPGAPDQRCPQITAGTSSFRHIIINHNNLEAHHVLHNGSGWPEGQQRRFHNDRPHRRRAF